MSNPADELTAVDPHAVPKMTPLSSIWPSHYNHFQSLLKDLEASHDTKTFAKLSELLRPRFDVPTIIAAALTDHTDPYKYPRQQTEHERKFLQLKIEFDEKQAELFASKAKGAELEEKFAKLEHVKEQYEREKDLNHLLSRVCPAAASRLLEDRNFGSLFEQTEMVEVFVISIDIRRSTELMLKAKNPRVFASFITEIASELKATVLGNFGIFDKFTGDGILAYFPLFYSGKDAGFRVVKTAIECHEVFKCRYAANKDAFNSVLLEAGLGIGIDYGLAQIVRISGDLTVVGTPVVYACRMGGTYSGQTFLNRPAYTRLFEVYSSFFSFLTTEIDLKNEGRTLAYSVTGNGRSFEPALPDWLENTTPST